MTSEQAIARPGTVAGAIRTPLPLVELLFPAWVLVLSVHVLVASFRSAPAKDHLGIRGS